MDRVILHSDINSCYANIELLHHPELQGIPLAVGGNAEKRHGIILAKDELAKKCGVKTGMALWEARKICPEINILHPRMDLYLRFSKMAHEIYADYTDQQEPFGIDESWLDVTGSTKLIADGEKIAKDISQRMKFELGITVSIGVSWNKIFAKLGSDYKKPDAITMINKENYKNIAWPLPVEELLYVGRSTSKKLRSAGISTIGALALKQPQLLRQRLGKMGLILHSFANGWDTSPVARDDYRSPIKSIGNSTTTPRDLTTNEDVFLIIYVLSESVATRLRENSFKCRVVEIGVRDKDLYSFTRQITISRPTNIAKEIADTAFSLFKANYWWHKPIRSICVRGSGLISAYSPEQLDLFVDESKRDKAIKLERAVDDIRRRFGYYSIQRAVMYTDRELTSLNAREENTVHPRGFFG